MSKTIYMLSVILLLQCAGGFPVPFTDKNTDVWNNETQEISFYMEYLEKYGYLEPLDTKGKMRVNQTEITNALKKFQEMMGIPVTGIFDDATNDTMLMPRCGVKDINEDSRQTRVKRFVLEGSSWGGGFLTYRLANSPNYLNKDDVDLEIKKAFNMWSKHAVLDFFNKANWFDIELKFAGSVHGDGMPFKDMEIAHAFYPRYGGDIHFNENLDWTIGSPSVVDVLAVAVHEIGHALGLKHSSVHGSVMYPTYKDYDPNLELHDDDIKGIQKVYGIRSQGATDQTTSTTTGKPEPDPHIFCKNATLDAITRKQNGTTFVFKGNYYYQVQYISSVGLVPGQPRPIHDWANISGPIDAALTWDRVGITFLFKGEHYWKFNNTDFIYGPRLIYNDFPGVPDHVDAAFVWSGNNRTYFIKGDYYWRYNMYTGMVDSNYPRPLSVWRGLPSKIDAAIKWKYLHYDWKTYFFSGHKYYRLSDREIRVEKVASTARVWFSCPDANAAASYMAAERDLQDIKAGGAFFEISILGGAKIITIDMNLLFLMFWCVLAIIRSF